jgi:hypothetical protein
MGNILTQKLKLDKVPFTVLESSKVGLLQDGNVIIDQDEWARNYAKPCGIHVAWPAEVQCYTSHM